MQKKLYIRNCTNGQFKCHIDPFGFAQGKLKSRCLCLPFDCAQEDKDRTLAQTIKATGTIVCNR